MPVDNGKIAQSLSASSILLPSLPFVFVDLWSVDLKSTDKSVVCFCKYRTFMPAFLPDEPILRIIIHGIKLMGTCCIPQLSFLSVTSSFTACQNEIICVRSIFHKPTSALCISHSSFLFHINFRAIEICVFGIFIENFISPVGLSRLMPNDASNKVCFNTMQA